MGQLKHPPFNCCVSLPASHLKYPQEDLDRYTVYVCLYPNRSSMENVPNASDIPEEVIIEVLADEGDNLIGTVANTPRFSDMHGYSKGMTYRIAKSQIRSYTRSLKQVRA